MREPTINQAIEQYLNHVRVGKRKRTKETYGTALNHFRTFLAETAPPHPDDPAAELTVDHALRFVEWLTDNYGGGRLEKPTLRTYLSGISGFYAYIIRHRLAPIEPHDHQRLIEDYRDHRKGSYKRLPRPAGDEEIARLIQALGSVPSGDDPRAELASLRNVAIVHVLRCTGVRVGELVSLRVRDLSLGSLSARVIGKGNKERIVYFDTTGWEAMTAYLDARSGGAPLMSIADEPVFARHDNEAGQQVLPISTRSVQRIFDRGSTLAGLRAGSVTPHSLRHSFGTRLVAATGDLAVTQELMGHSSPETTKRYVEVTESRLRDAHREAFGPADGKA